MSAKYLQHFFPVWDQNHAGSQTQCEHIKETFKGKECPLAKKKQKKRKKNSEWFSPILDVSKECGTQLI